MNPQPRVLVFPFAAQGHVTSMLKLSELLADSGIHVTFLATEHVHRRLVRHGGSHDVILRSIPDGLPKNHPRSPETLPEVYASMRATAKPLLKQFLASDGNTASCLIADGIFGNFPIEVGEELGIPVIHFRTTSACYFWATFCIPEVIRAGELPIKGEDDKDRLIKSVTGMESFLRCRDLPHYLQLAGTSSGTKTMFDLMEGVAGASSRAHGLILNTFEHLEGPILSQIRENCNANTYAIGPLHARPINKLSDQRSSLRQVEDNCITWLDSQPPSSVVYVSFGSLVSLTKDNLLEFWNGLVSSGVRFLLAVRSDLLAAGEEIPNELLPTRNLVSGSSPAPALRHYIAEWVPQEEVLSHVAVGGFLTHSGWNSTLESIVCGVPMLCWPCSFDQPINSRYVGEVWKLGIDMKDVCDRHVVTKLLNDLMVERRDELARSMAQVAQLARSSVSPSGSSSYYFNRLIQDLYRMMNK